MTASSSSSPWRRGEQRSARRVPARRSDQRGPDARLGDLLSRVRAQRGVGIAQGSEGLDGDGWSARPSTLRRYRLQVWLVKARAAVPVPRRLRLRSRPLIDVYGLTPYTTRMGQRRRDNRLAVERLEVRCTSTEKHVWLEAAAHAKRSLSDWARLSLSEAAAASTKGEHKRS